MIHAPAIATVIAPRDRDIGGFSVRRALPDAKWRSVGPFVFFDEMGPAVFAPGTGIDVRPHPHIGLATLTYLLDGALIHRDSLGVTQLITPGAVNLMVAGRGVAHSERSPETFRQTGGLMHGWQFWLALPQAQAAVAPSFVHVEAADLPGRRAAGASLRLIIGAFDGLVGPQWFAPCFLADLTLEAGACFTLGGEHRERALYVTAGEISLAGEVFSPGKLVVLTPGARVELSAGPASRVALFGGAPLDGSRFLWWNFVASTRETILAARADWEAGRFPIIDGESDSIPAPELKAL